MWRTRSSSCPPCRTRRAAPPPCSECRCARSSSPWSSTPKRGLVVCLVPGDAHVDRARLSAELGCRSAAPIAAAKVVSLTGYRPSALPPCGLAADLPIVADPAVFELPVVYCGGGTTTTMLKIRSADLRVALDLRVAAIAARPQNGAASHWAAG